MQYFVALGANLGEPEKAFNNAAALIAQEIGRISAYSSLYETAALLHPLNNSPQPDYLNAVVALDSQFHPPAALDRLIEIEKRLGRLSTAAVWAPRIIDLDLLAAEFQVIESARLVLPHPEMHKRDFVLMPLSEVAPKWRHPVSGQTVREMLKSMPSPGLVKSVRPWKQGGNPRAIL